MSEDELRAKIDNLNEKFDRLSDEGRERSRKLEEILMQVTRTNGRVNGLEQREREWGAKLDKVDKRVWQVATALSIALPGVGKIIGLF